MTTIESLEFLYVLCFVVAASVIIGGIVLEAIWPNK